MTGEAWLLVTMVLVGAAWLVVHVVTLVQALRAEDLETRWRVLALVPPATPFVAWKGGKRIAPALWLGVLVCYVVLRIVGG